MAHRLPQAVIPLTPLRRATALRPVGFIKKNLFLQQEYIVQPVELPTLAASIVPIPPSYLAFKLLNPVPIEVAFPR